MNRIAIKQVKRGQEQLQEFPFITCGSG